jgi:hypothetical protein
VNQFMEIQFVQKDGDSEVWNFVGSEEDVNYFF